MEGPNLSNTLILPVFLSLRNLSSNVWITFLRPLSGVNLTYNTPSTCAWLDEFWILAFCFF